MDGFFGSSGLGMLAGSQFWSKFVGRKLAEMIALMMANL